MLGVDARARRGRGRRNDRGVGRGRRRERGEQGRGRADALQKRWSDEMELSGVGGGRNGYNQMQKGLGITKLT